MTAALYGAIALGAVLGATALWAYQAVRRMAREEREREWWATQRDDAHTRLGIHGYEKRPGQLRG